MPIRRPVGMQAFLVIWFGQLVSTVGSSLTAWGLGVRVYQETGSTEMYMITLLCWVAPTILFAPLAGMVADRFDRRMVLIFADLLGGLGTLSVILALSFGRLEIWHIYLVSAISSTANTFQWPAHGAATTMLVPKEQLGRAGGLVQLGEAVSQLVTPALAGIIYMNIGMQGIVSIDLATLLVAVLTLLVIRIPRPAATLETTVSKPSFWSELTFGWRYLLQRPGMIGLLTYFAIGNFFASLALALFTPMLLNMTTPNVLGWVGSIGGVGMLVGTLVMSTWGGPRHHRVHAILLADVFGAIAAMIMGLRAYIPLIAVGEFLVMFTIPISNGNSQAFWQSKVAPDVQGRVFAIRRMIAFSIIPLSYIAAGVLTERVFEPAMLPGGSLASVFGGLVGTGPGRGTGLMFVLMGAAWGLSALLTLLYPRVRHLEREVPDVQAEIALSPTDLPVLEDGEKAGVSPASS